MIKKHYHIVLFLVLILVLRNSQGHAGQSIAKDNFGHQQDTTKGRSKSGLVEKEIIPDLKSIYLGGVKGDDNIRFLDTARNLSDDSIKYHYIAVNDFNFQSFKKKKISEDLLKRVNRVNMGFQEYLWYKRLRDTYHKNNTNDRSLIAILIRDGQSTTINPKLLLEQLDKYPEEYKITDEWKELKRRLVGKDVTGYSLVEHEDHKMINARGEKISIKELASRKYFYTLVVFTASWCAPCHIEYEMFKNDFDSLAHKNVHLISYSLDEKIDRWKILLQKKNYIAECYCDQQGFRSPFVRELNIQSIPTYVLFDRQGTVVKKVTGNVQEMFKYINEGIREENKH